MPPPRDFNKVRVYQCVCGGTTIRSLRGRPKPCERCDTPLDGRPHQIEDMGVWLTHYLAGRRRPPGER